MLQVLNAQQHTNVNMKKQLQHARDTQSTQVEAPRELTIANNPWDYVVRADCFRILDSEVPGTSRNIKEALFIRVNDPTLNRNLGKYQLPHIWDNILQDTTPMLQLK